LRDRGLLQSAIAQTAGVVRWHVRASRPVRDGGGVLVPHRLEHPFVDGNKRAGLLAAQVFLDVNGMTIEHDSEAFYALTMGVAEGRIDKAAVAAELERIAKSKPAT
jgi:death-on-curing protein